MKLIHRSSLVSQYGRKKLEILFLLTILLSFSRQEAIGQGNAVSFDGVDDHITVAHASVLNLDDQFTLEAWVYINDNATTNEAIIHKWQTNQYTLELNGNKFTFVIRTSDAFYVLASPNNLPRDRWVHVAGVRDGGTMYVYEDGVQTNSRSVVGTTNTATSGPLFFGRRSDYVGDIMKGKLGEARIWNIARSSAQIADNYSSTLTGSETGLVGLWNFEETSGTTTYDATSNALNGTLINGPAFVATAYSNGTATETYFTSGTFIVPAGISSVTVEAWGGGGGGGGSTGAVNSGGGGGGGFSKSILSVNSLTGYAVNVGSGGGVGNGTNGVVGGDSWFNTVGTLLAKGGGFGSSNGNGGIGGLATSGVGTTKYSGGNGINGGLGSSNGSGAGSSAGFASNGQPGVGRIGGLAPSGGGDGGDGGIFEPGVNTSQIGRPGTVPGGGGGGSGNGSTGTCPNCPSSGGAGAKGQIKVSYTQPTASITYNDVDAIVAVGQSLTITATFSEAIADAPIMKISLSGANTLAATDMVKVSPTVYTFTHTVAAGSGITSISLSTGVSVTGNAVYNTPSSGGTFTVQSFEPTTQANMITFSDIWSEGMKVGYTNGSGNSRLLVAKAGSAVDATPVDLSTYTANANFGSGSQLGTGNYVVGMGSGPISVTGLTVGTTYHFQVFEFNGSNGGQNYNVNTASGNPSSASTLVFASQTITQTFSSNGTFNVPAGITKVKVEAWGGGGGGGTAVAASLGGGGGGGGAYSMANLNVVPMSSPAVTVGQGGTSGIGGGDSWFNTSVTMLAKGGDPGLSTSSCCSNASGGQASFGIGDIKFSGGNGGRGTTASGGKGGGGGASAGTSNNGQNGQNGVNVNGGPGGSPGIGTNSGGSGGYGADMAGVGVVYVGTIPGGGGGGGLGSSPLANGSSGANGKLIVTYTQPTSSITYDDADANVAVGQSLIITATFSEYIADAPIMKISLSGANTLAATNMTKVTSNVYSYTHTVTAGTGATTISLSSGTSTSGNSVISSPVSGATFNILSIEPTTQANTLSFTASTTTCSVNYNNGNGTSRLLVAKAGSAVDADPVDGTAYTPNTVFGSGPQLGTGNFVVGAGSGAISVTGLTPGVTYHFRAYEFNGTGTITNYNTNTATGNPASKTTLSLSSFTPTNAGEGTTVTITGTDFTGATAVSFGGTAATSFNVISPTSITAVVPDGTSGDLSVTTPGGTVTKTGFIFIPKPVATTATAITQTSFNSNWSASTGASGYFLDVSTSNLFDTYVAGFENLSVGNVTTYAVNTNLIAGTAYYYRVRASAVVPLTSSSNSISLVTVPPEPVISSAGATSGALSIAWEPVPGASGFILDLSTDNFVNFVAGYAGVTISGPTSHTATGLLPSTTYQVRIRSQNLNGISSNSNAVDITTIASKPIGQPTGLTFSNISSTDISISFLVATGTPDGYLVLYKAASSPTESPVDGTAYVQGATLGASKVAYVGSSNTFSLSGLSPNTDYFFSIFSFNGTEGASSYLLTSPLKGNKSTLSLEPTSQPTGITFSAITATALDISYTEASGSPSGYLILRKAGAMPTEIPVDGTEYTAGSLLGTSTVLYAGSALQVTDSGLLPGTAYNYSIFALNGSANTYNYLTTTPLQGSQITLPVVPVLDAATGFSQTSFDLSWAAVTGASNYELDVSIDDFLTKISGFDAKLLGNVATASVSGLTSGTSYKARIRSVNAAGTSTNSNEVSVLTVPAEPVLSEASDVTASAITSNWIAVTGASAYLLDISIDNFNNFVAGYNGLVVNGTSYTATSLNPGTNFQFRLRASNSSGVSGTSNVLEVATLNDVAPAPLTIAPISFSGMQAADATQALTIAVSGGEPPYVVTAAYKGLLESEFVTVTLDETTGVGNYLFSVVPDMLDELGMEFTLTAKDAKGNEQSRSGSIALSFAEANSPPIPLERFGGTTLSWNLFTIPYELDNKLVSNIFADLDQNRHEFDWRIVRYRNSTNDYVNFNTGQVKVGEAYWFNSKTPVSIQVGAGQTTSQVPFSLSLLQGWNLIGNPYAVDVSWEQVLAANPDKSGIDPIKVFNGSALVNGDVLQPFVGGFVFAEEATSVAIDPIASKPNGRIINGKGSIESTDIDDLAWLIPLHLSDGQTIATLGGVGMHPDALEMKDKFDGMAPPRFIDYSEMYTTHEDYFYPYFSTDVVPTKSDHAWSFTLSSNKTAGPSNLTWDMGALQGKASGLYLLDQQSGKLVDMKITGSHQVDLSKGDFKFEIYFTGSGNQVIPNQLFLGDAYPNPASTQATIPLLLPGSANELVDIDLSVYDMNGNKVATLASGKHRPGVYEFTWDIGTAQKRAGSGLFFYRLSFGDNSRVPLYKKLILR